MVHDGGGEAAGSLLQVGADMLDILAGQKKFNGRVDAASIMATLARKNGQTLKNIQGGIEFFPVDQAVIRKARGTVMLPSGVLINAENFFQITPWQDDYARRLVRFLNYELSHDGVWAVCWCNPTEDGYATELRYGFQDEDGDLQIALASDLTLVDLQTVDDVKRHGNVVEQAYQKWVEWKEEVDVRPDQTIKAAQGQSQADPRVQPLV